ncbi:MAG TPA: PHP domain-containing protein [Planctomycetota bacterium]|jgi:hypothetical protein
MTTDRVDLHCHSTASDGRWTQHQLVSHAARIGLKALALTDHDTLAGLPTFHQAGRELGLETVSGVEISTKYTKGTMHMLGLFVEPNDSFRAFLKELADGRKIRNPQIITKLNALGLTITMAEVEREAGLSDNDAGGGAIDKSVGRPHIASVLVSKGYVRNKQEAFEKYLAKGQPAYVSRFVASPEDSIGHIHAAGGLAILAHPPYLGAADDAEMYAIVGDLKSKGLDGIEVLYSTHTAEQQALCARLAQKYDLVPSGGSDFHGEPGTTGKMIELGYGFGGSLNVPYSVLAGLKERWAARKGA